MNLLIDGLPDSVEIAGQTIPIDTSFRTGILFEELMLDTKMLVKDVGTMLDGPQAVEEGLIDEVGGIARALEKLNELMKKAAGTDN